MQNKMHYAVHGNTAAEVIVARANHTKDHMGLTSWRNAPDGKIVKADVSIAKNYLSIDEMQELNFRQMLEQRTFYHKACIKHLAVFLQIGSAHKSVFADLIIAGIRQGKIGG